MRVVSVENPAGVPSTCGTAKLSSVATNVMTPDAARVGRSNGRVTVRRVAQPLAPEHRAARSSSGWARVTSPAVASK